MITFFAILCIGAAVGLFFSANTRRAKLARLANLLHLPFDEERSSITTVDTAKHLEFLAQGKHQFKHVVTYSDSAAFMRLADDVWSGGITGEKHPLTLFSAEIKHGRLPVLKIVPENSPFVASTYERLQNPPAGLSNPYVFYVPTQRTSFTLPKALNTLLQTHENIYLEINDNAFVYHEHTLVEPEDWQTFRVRALQVLQEVLRIVPAPPLSKPGKHPDSFAPDPAQAIMAALTSSRTHTQNAQFGSWRKIGMAALLAALAGVCLLAWALLQRFVH